MGQHLYPCQCCGVNGVAHYRLVEAEPLPELAAALGPIGGDGRTWENVLLCTGCHKAGCDARVPCRRFP